MNTKQLERGQGLVEYAIIIALVAIVAAVAIGLIGRAAQRGYGVVGGALGAKHDSVGERVIEITTSQCIAKASTHETGMWILGITNEDVANLTASTEQAIGTGMDGLRSPVEADLDSGPSSFVWHPLLSHDQADLSLCPKAIVIQAEDGTIAISPVAQVTMP